ncbi:hypothetical protein MLD38_029989 [Melastoma candidum]|uniref:Uncharacterized protein n=1 Tax=Melastoma candidum TaxID=119954 RepID=A0ACB9MK58_9MYRT|nr:hypothetical protein MLD38_029989 [Melastoma candidum]
MAIREEEVEVAIKSTSMERWGRWLWLSLRRSFLFRAKSMFVKASSSLKHKAKENRQGLVSLYRDLEICGGEYRDIRVMWEMIQSSRPPVNHHEASVIGRQRGFCFSSN